VLDHQLSQTLQRSMCASKTTNTHSYKSYVTSAYWAQSSRSTTETWKEGEKVVKQVVRKPAITNPVGPHGLCFISWWVFVARYSLRYFNQYETKCIIVPICWPFLSRISKHYLHGSIIKMCISWFLSWRSHQHCLVFANVQNFVEDSRKPQRI